MKHEVARTGFLPDWHRRQSIRRKRSRSRVEDLPQYKIAIAAGSKYIMVRRISLNAMRLWRSGYDLLRRSNAAIRLYWIDADYGVLRLWIRSSEQVTPG